MIFELQVILIANIPGISASALAAGAIWIQSEAIVAAIHDGWVKVGILKSKIFFDRSLGVGAKKICFLLETGGREASAF